MSGKFNFSLVDTDSTARKFKDVESALSHLAPSVRASLMPIIPKFTTKSYIPGDFSTAIPTVWTSSTITVEAVEGYSHVFAFIDCSFTTTAGQNGTDYVDGIITRNGTMIASVSSVNYVGPLGGNGFGGTATSAAKIGDQYAVKLAVPNGDPGTSVNIHGFSLNMNCIYYN